MMTARPARTLDTPQFALAARIARRLLGQSQADEATLAAVATLTADADPERAERLRPRPGEPAALVERLALWALHRASDEAVAQASARLDTELVEVSTARPIAC